MLSKQCKLHLEEQGETGCQHMKAALTAPRFFTNTASNVMTDILNSRKSETCKK